jgi:DNA repair protein RecN (Recombination protein N)
MLLQLRIKNFAIIKEQEIEFGSGLNVISGETGSGKSLIMHALDFVLGGKLGTGFVRSGAKSLEVEAVFTLEGLPDEVRSELPDILDDEDFVVSRTAADSGKGKVYINGRLATAGVLRQVARTLVTICSQAEHIQLLDPKAHRTLLDNYAGTSKELESYQTVYNGWREVDQQLNEALDRFAKAESRRIDLEEELAVFRSIAIETGLRETLEEEIERLKSGELLRAEANEYLSLLLDERGLLSLLESLRGHARALAGIDPHLAFLEENQESAEAALTDCEQQLQSYMENFEVDDEALETTRERLAEVARLERKYRVTGDGLFEIYNAFEAELQNLPTPERIAVLERQKQELDKTLHKTASVLRLKREKAARDLEKKITVELAELNMAGAAVAAQFADVSPGKYGTEAVELMLRSNPGEPAKPLRKIASGGELSRLTLVLKKLLRDTARINVLVFDEVDTGISGSVARAVGAKLKSLAENSQVLCVSHLPQVASLADRNLLVEKSGTSRVESRVRLLEGEERVEEIARMISGFEVTEAAKESARELLTVNV